MESLAGEYMCGAVLSVHAALPRRLSHLYNESLEKPLFTLALENINTHRRYLQVIYCGKDMLFSFVFLFFFFNFFLLFY